MAGEDPSTAGALASSDGQDAERGADHHLGCHDGRTEGMESDPYVADNLRHMYRRGYDAGIADYSVIVEDPFTGRAYIKGESK